MSKVKTPEKHQIKLSEINEMSICVFIVKRKEEDRLKKIVKQFQGRVISIIRGIGVSRTSAFSSLKVGTDDMDVFLTAVRDEDVKKYMSNVSNEFELFKPGNGKGFAIEADGYLGAKALFIGD